MNRSIAIHLALAGSLFAGCSPTPPVVVGAKKFTESVILAELGARLAGESALPRDAPCFSLWAA